MAEDRLSVLPACIRAITFSLSSGSLNTFTTSWKLSLFNDLQPNMKRDIERIYEVFSFEKKRRRKKKKKKKEQDILYLPSI
jgi:hypothetical protein